MAAATPAPTSLANANANANANADDPPSPATPNPNPINPPSNQNTSASDQQPVSANPLFVIQPSPFVSSTPPDLEPEVGGLTKVHVQALDEIISVNSFFTVAVFIGFSLTNPSADGSLVGKCFVGADFTKYLLVFEVIAFSSYLLSSLIAQGLKLFIVILNSKDQAEVLSAQIKPQVLRFGMLFTVIGTTVGTVFLTLSIVFFIQIRLGLLHCDNVWSKWATIPVVTMVAGGLVTFLLSSLYAFST